ncbi:MAG: Mpo1-like protein [Phycisphaerae bacterium]
MTNLFLKAYRNWRGRHLNAVSFALHVVGIPACFVAAPILLLLRHWEWAAWCFAGGYVLQFAGHWIEGNRSGEELLLRRILKKP